MSRVYYKGAMGALVVFDITKSSSLKGAAEWKQDLDSKVRLSSGRPIPAVLLANKCDLKERDEDLMSSLDSFCEDNSFSCWFETSAKVCVVAFLKVSVGGSVIFFSQLNIDCLNDCVPLTVCLKVFAFDEFYIAPFCPSKAISGSCGSQLDL